MLTLWRTKTQCNPTSTQHEEATNQQMHRVMEAAIKFIRRIASTTAACMEHNTHNMGVTFLLCVSTSKSRVRQPEMENYFSRLTLKFYIQ